MDSKSKSNRLLYHIVDSTFFVISSSSRLTLPLLVLNVEMLLKSLHQRFLCLVLLQMFLSTRTYWNSDKKATEVFVLVLLEFYHCWTKNLLFPTKKNQEVLTGKKCVLDVVPLELSNLLKVLENAGQQEKNLSFNVIPSP